MRAILGAVLALAASWHADLTVVGPEAPLAAGVADLFLSAGPTALRSDAGRGAAGDEQGLRERA